MFHTGDYVPWYIAHTTVGLKFVLEKFAGRYLVLCFFGSTTHPFSRRVLDDVECHCERFNGEDLVFVGVSADPRDANLIPGWKHGIYLCDPTGQLSRVYEVISTDGTQYQLQSIILDPMLRVASVFPFDGDSESYVPRLLDFLSTLPALQSLTGHAPIIILPHVFESEFCQTLIRLYEQHGGHDSGGMMDKGGKSVSIIDRSLKSRSDHEISDESIKEAALYRLRRRLFPEVARAFQFNVEAVERQIVACYDAAVEGHFRAHRDNTTELTAYRKFAVTINLNAEDYEGGDLWFPEYGSRLYRCPTGGAVVFSCTLHHEAKPVTRGRRFVYLPFLYDGPGYQQFLIIHRRMFPELHTDNA
jgi:peroxiredoxin